MAANQGYGRTNTIGLVFSYDVADSFNSFKGKPTTNLLPSINYTYGTTNTTYFKTSYGTETVYIPGLGRNVPTVYCNIYNDYLGGSGACCPNLFSYSSFSVSGNTSYVYQIIYRTNSGYVSANYMYQYQYGASGYIGEYGLYNSSREEDLGGGWKHAWGVFTTDPATTTMAAYTFHYEYGVYNKVQIAGIMLTQGTEVLRPSQFLPVAGTRSVNQSLYNLSKREPLDLSAVSFDSKGALVFDGTDDNIVTDIINLGANATFEAVIRSFGNVNTFNMYMGAFLPYMGVYNGNSIIFSDNIGGVQSTVVSSGGTITSNVWYHVICTRTYDGTNTTNSVYINGILSATNTFSGVHSESGTYFNVGDGWVTNWYPFNGYVAVAKIYNRPLSTIEINNNYKNYKPRFNLS